MHCRSGTSYSPQGRTRAGSTFPWSGLNRGSIFCYGATLSGSGLTIETRASEPGAERGANHSTGLLSDCPVPPTLTKTEQSNCNNSWGFPRGRGDSPEPLHLGAGPSFIWLRPAPRLKHTALVLQLRCGVRHTSAAQYCIFYL